MKKFLIIIFSFIALIIVYRYFGYAQNILEKIFLPSSFKKYPSLSKKILTSKEYHLEKVLDGYLNNDEYIFYNIQTKEFVIDMQDGDYDRGNQGWHTLWKMDNKGELVDSFSTQESLDTSGIFFEDEYYIDWIFSGEKNKKQYQQIINIDPVSQETLDSYIKNATSLAYNRNYNDEVFEIFVKRNKGWIVLRSKEIYKKYTEDDFKEKFAVKDPEKVFIGIKNEILPFQEWKNKDSFIYLQKFVGSSLSRKSFYDINNTSRSGRNGIGYFQFKHKTDIFNFKSYIFNDSTFGYSTDISVYLPFKMEKDLDVTLLYLGKNLRSKRDYDEVGLYVVRKNT